MSVKDELASARATSTAVPSVYVRPVLQLRLNLARFAIEHGLADESEALAVVAARYFQIEESDKWAQWAATRPS